MLLFDVAGPSPTGARLAADESTGVEHEFKLEQAEIASVPCHDSAELLADLRARRVELRDAAAERGVRVAALGSCPVRATPTVTPDERYERMQDHFGLVARDQLTCGLHVHVSIASAAEGIAAIDGLAGRAAVLVALAANSPFLQGVDTGYASYRRVSWGRFPTAGPSAPFGSVEEYDRRVDELVTLRAALDVGMIYFDARLSAKYPTVELRVADSVQDVSDAAALGALCRALVESPLEPVGVDAARAASWYAARYGLVGDLCDLAEGRLRPAADVLDRVVDGVRAALQRYGDTELVEGFVARRLAEGSWAEVQRREYAVHGSPAEVVDAAVARTA